MKHIVITGSSRGIGLCMAKCFLKEGCTVTISGRSEDRLEIAKDILSVYADRVQYITCNVQHKADIDNLLESALHRWGRIDHWINNAGANTPYRYVYETDIHALNTVIDTNIKGMILGSQAAAKHMMKAGSGQIWNMEGLGSNNMIQPKTVLYGMTKSALTYFTRGLAKELKDTGVLAGRLSPGMMLTDFITKAPDGEKSEVTEEAQFRRVFNILGDKPETVAAFLVPKMLSNTRQNAHIVWLSNAKASLRFMAAPFRKRNLI